MKVIVISTLTLLIGGLSWGAATFDDEADRDYKKAYDLVLGERWADAQKAFETLIAENPGSRWQDDAAFWICFAREKGSLSPEESFRCYREFIEQHPHSEWRDDAARTLVMLGRGLAEKGQPEYLAEARAILEKDHHYDEPDHELMAMLESVAERDPSRATEIVFKYYDRSDDARVRAQIVALMHDLEGEEVTRKLGEIVRKESSSEVRINAVEALADRTESSLAREVLMEVVRSEQYPEELRTDVLSVMGDNDFPGKQAILEEIILGTDNDELFHAALYALADEDSAASTSLLISLYDKITDRDRRHNTLYAIAETETASALTFLSKVALNSEDPEVAAQAVSAFEGFSPTMAMTPLQKILEGEAHWRVKVAAAYAIGQIESPEGIGVLAALAKTETHPEVLRAAIGALGDTDRPEAVPVLVGIIRSQTNPSMRRMAIEALDNLSDLPAARDAMLKLLEERLEAEDNE